jgi:hypothetical protein
LDWHGSPVAGEATRLKDYLAEKSLSEIQFLTAERFLTDVSGLSMESIRLLSMKQSLSVIERDNPENENKFLHLRAKDPHQMVIGNRADQTNNIITGR